MLHTTRSILWLALLLAAALARQVSAGGHL